MRKKAGQRRSVASVGMYRFKTDENFVSWPSSVIAAKNSFNYDDDLKER